MLEKNCYVSDKKAAFYFFEAIFASVGVILTTLSILKVEVIPNSGLHEFIFLVGIVFAAFLTIINWNDW